MKAKITALNKNYLVEFKDEDQFVSFLTQHNDKVNNVEIINEDTLPELQKPVQVAKPSMSDGWKTLEKSSFTQSEKNVEKKGMTLGGKYAEFKYEPDKTLDNAADSKVSEPTNDSPALKDDTPEASSVEESPKTEEKKEEKKEIKEAVEEDDNIGGLEDLKKALIMGKVTEDEAISYILDWGEAANEDEAIDLIGKLQDEAEAELDEVKSYSETLKTNSNQDYQRGYADGQESYKMGHYVPADESDEESDEYNQGYDDGFEDAKEGENKFGEYDDPFEEEEYTGDGDHNEYDDEYDDELDEVFQAAGVQLDEDWKNKLRGAVAGLAMGAAVANSNPVNAHPNSQTELLNNPTQIEQTIKKNTGTFYAKGGDDKMYKVEIRYEDGIYKDQYNNEWTEEGVESIKNGEIPSGTV